MTGCVLDAMAHSAARHYGSERVSDVGHFAVDQFLVFDRVGGARAGARGHQEVGADLKGARAPRSRTVQVSRRA